MAKQQTDFENKKKINLNITTPRGLKFVEKADMLVMRCIDGDLGILSGHTPVFAALGDGILRICNNGIEKKLAVFGGIVEIKDTTVNIFSTIVQHPDEIDLERAEADRKEVEEILQEKAEDLQIQGLQVLLRRSLVRIEVSVQMDDSDDGNNNGGS